MFTARCLVCGRDSNATPLIPVPIHNPVELVGKLPGAETLAPADHHD